MKRMASIPISSLPPVNTTLSGTRLLLARLGWALITGLGLLLLILIAPRNPRSLLFDPMIQDSYQLLASLMTYRGYLQYILFLRYVVTGFFFLIAVLIFWRKSNDWLALLTSIALICIPYVVFFGGILYSLKFPAPWGDWYLAADGLITFLGLLSIPLLLLVFPDGQIQPRRSVKLVKWLFAILFIAGLIPQTDESDIAFYAWFLLSFDFVLLLLIGITGQVYRYLRISTPIQRQQTKWILFSILVNLFWVIFLVFRVDNQLRFTAASLYGLFDLHASLVLVGLIPISVAISVLRYHLYNIDVLIRRTLVYGILTAILALIYFSGVTLLQSLFSEVSGMSSTLAIVLSTLAIAALFNPLRKRIQNGIDRRFYRQKYDAEKTLSAFAAVARDETDLEALSEELLRVVEETMQPESASLWLREINK